MEGVVLRLQEEVRTSQVSGCLRVCVCWLGVV